MTRFSVSRRNFIGAAAGTAAAVGLAGCGGDGGGEGQTYSWYMTITVGNTSAWWVGAEKFGQLLEEKSGGRITLNIFGNEQLSSGDPAAGIEMLQNNQKAFSYNSTIIYAGLASGFHR